MAIRKMPFMTPSRCAARPIRIFANCGWARPVTSPIKNKATPCRMSDLRSSIFPPSTPGDPDSWQRHIQFAGHERHQDKAGYAIKMGTDQKNNGARRRRFHGLWSRLSGLLAAAQGGCAGKARTEQG